MTVFTFLFAFACLTTFAAGIRKEWKHVRIISMIVAILAFALALGAASLNK